MKEWDKSLITISCFCDPHPAQKHPCLKGMSPPSLEPIPSFLPHTHKKNPTPAGQGPIIALGFSGLPLFSWLTLCLFDVLESKALTLPLQQRTGHLANRTVNLTQDSGHLPSEPTLQPPPPPAGLILSALMGCVSPLPSGPAGGCLLSLPLGKLLGLFTEHQTRSWPSAGGVNCCRRFGTQHPLCSGCCSGSSAHINSQSREEGT